MVTPVFGSGEATIGFDTVTLTSIQHKLEIRMSRVEAGKSEFQVRILDKTIKISPEFLFDAKDIDSESIRLIVVSNPGHTVNLADGFTISFVVGRTYEHGENLKGEEVQVCPVIRLYFKEGELRRSVMAVPSGDFKNEWHFLKLARNSEGHVVDETDKDDVESSVRCPWTISVKP